MSRRLALAVMPLVLAGLMLPGQAASAAQPAAASQPGCVIPVPILCPSPSPSGGGSPSPSPSPDPTGSASPAPSASASPTGSPTADPSPSPSASPKRRKASSVKAAASAGLQVSEAQFTLVTGSALLLGASYVGVAQVPTATPGQTVPMMEFTMNSLTLDGAPTLTVTQGGVSSVTSGTSMQFTGNVVLYATQLSGSLLGVPVTITPSSPLATILKLLNSVTPLVPLKLTNVTTNQPYISSNSLQIPGLRVAS
ncbi:MAG TPA: hypothetical protein VF933_04015 [Streptosporangiaceae bacterium]